MPIEVRGRAPDVGECEHSRVGRPAFVEVRQVGQIGSVYIYYNTEHKVEEKSGYRPGILASTLFLSTLCSVLL